MENPADGHRVSLSTTASSFAQAVHIFRHRANRIAPIDAPAKFERVFIALYDTAPGPEFGANSLLRRDGSASEKRGSVLAANYGGDAD